MSHHLCVIAGYQIMDTHTLGEKASKKLRRQFFFLNVIFFDGVGSVSRDTRCSWLVRAFVLAWTGDAGGVARQAEVQGRDGEERHVSREGRARRDGPCGGAPLCLCDRAKAVHQNAGCFLAAGCHCVHCTAQLLRLCCTVLGCRALCMLFVSVIVVRYSVGVSSV